MDTPIEWSNETTKRLVQLLTNIDKIDTYSQRLVLLQKADLEILRDKLSFDTDSEVFAYQLIKECQRIGQVKRESIDAVNLLLIHLKQVVAGHPDHLQFIQTLQSNLHRNGLNAFRQGLTEYMVYLEKFTMLYYAKMEDWHGKTHILGKPDPVPLNSIFTDVYMLNTPHYMRASTIDALEAANVAETTITKENERHNGLFALEKHHRLFVVGKPGAGKTTFLRWITLMYAKDSEKKVPIFVSLKDLADARRTVLQQIILIFDACQVPNPQSFTETLLLRGDAVVLFDGLDEVQGEDGMQDKVINDIRDFVRYFHLNQYIVTCRVAAITYRFENFKYVEVADFTPTQITTYIKKYFAPYEEDANACISELKKSNHKNLREMAKSPLLLSLLCLNFEENRIFPPRRVDLYEEGLKTLLTRWDKSRRIKRDEPYKQLPPSRKPHLYTHIAYINFLAGRQFIRSELLTAQIEGYLQTVPSISELHPDGEIVLRSMEAQHGIVVERARRIHAFSHLTFQEYYVAKYIVENPISGFDELMQHVTETRWREVFLLTASLLSNADTFFERFLVAVANIAEFHISVAHLLEEIMVRTSYYPHLLPLEARIWAIQSIIMISYARAHDRALNNYTYHFHEVRKGEHLRTLTFDLIYALDRTLALDNNRALALALDRALSSNHVIVSLEVTIRLDILLISLGISLWLAENLVIIRDLAIDSAKELQMPFLVKSLYMLELPTQDEIGNDNVWRTFREQIAVIALEHWGLRINWEFNYEEADQINNYLYATELLVQCLNLAVVTDREGIKDRLFLPPSA